VRERLTRSALRVRARQRAADARGVRALERTLGSKCYAGSPALRTSAFFLVAGAREFRSSGESASD
jgi:hypothetical protein